ncbi:MAG TPA: phage major capsid protein [Solirubrobacterales bacterium]|nr:phage major capsid protein [Solirubrobacterales bacterium]
MLEDKLKDLKKAIEVKTEEVQTAYKAFDEKRKELQKSDADITDPNSEAVKAADEAMKPYSEKSEELARLKGQFERIAMIAADGGDQTFEIRQKNELDRHPQEARETLGQKAAQHERYKELVKSGALAAGSEQKFGQVPITEPLDREQTKSLLTGQSGPAGGVLNVPERFPGVYDLPQLPLSVLDLVTQGGTDENAVEFIRILARTINAKEVAEAATSADVGGEVTTALAGVKPESGLTFDELLEGVRTIAHWIPATRNSLADAPFLQTLVDAEMQDGVRRRAESQIIKGNGTAPNIRGIENTAGIASHDQEDIVADTRADAVHRILTLLALAGYSPTGVGFNPLDWQEIRLSKDKNENYIWGPPSMAGLMQIWGVPVVSSVAFAEDTAIAGEWARALFLIREGIKVLISDSHKDWFTRNIVAILAEMRAVLIVPRPQAFGEVNFK